MIQRFKIQANSQTWRALFIITTFIAYIYVFAEWLFIITKPSSMSALSFTKKVEVLLFSSSLLAIGCCLILLIFAGISSFPILRTHHKAMVRIGALLPAGILASAILLLVDNFSYTMFNYGIVSTEGYIRGLYALAFTLVFGLCTKYVWTKLDFENHITTHRKSQKWLNRSLSGVILLSFIIPVAINDFGYREKNTTTSQILKKPHIFIINADGVSSTNVSVYGYERDTTPRIRELAETSLVADNAFSNSGNTAGSIICTFTSKYPTKTRLLYPPNILRDDDAYQHLPGILRTQGYYAVQMSVPHYGDAYTLNLLNAFDTANGREMAVSNQLVKINQYMPTDFAYFIYEIMNRLVDRLRHIFYIKTMTNPFDMVMNDPDNVVDQIKIDNTIKLIRKSDKPLFVHIHVMGTHGPKFYPQNQVFSKDQDYDTQENWSVDFYDDSILNFDRQVGEIMDALAKKDLLDDSILIISSDHGQQYITSKRIPLIIHFPNGEYAGKIETNVQNIDIAPTILDYLGVEIPFWMQGQTLLQANLNQRPIFSVRSTQAETDETGKFVLEHIPYFDQFWKISVMYCQKFYTFNLKTYEMYTGEVEGYIDPCRESELITDAEAFRLMRDRLEEDGFDVSPLNDTYLKLFPSE
ncbi:MAG: sulfatase-like hydrolase/transferase [Anaerolineales bacterium]|nr:sulfatase-like hydrolase/transferase [Anaerolineales bacterium]